MPEAAPPSDVKTPSPRQVVLGLFILFQLGFLIFSNLLGFVTSLPWELRELDKEKRRAINRVVPHFLNERGHGWEWCNQIEYSLRPWVQVTGQDQVWSLFAPSVNKVTGFPVVLLVWDEPAEEAPAGIPGTFFALGAKNGINLCADWTPSRSEEPSLRLACQMGLLTAQNPWELVNLYAACRLRQVEPAPRLALLLSENEPHNVYDYVRFGKLRLRKFEGQLYINPEPYDYETPADLAGRMTRRLRRFLNDSHDPAMAYLKWRLKGWQREHPDRPAPKQILLLERFYRIHPPDEPRGWDGPYLIPLARWQPNRRPPAEDYVLEAYDFTNQRFYSVTR
jgi:hypothetical protein